MVQVVPGQRVHIVGIGGFGMSAIGRILLRRGFQVSGSDRNRNALTAALSDEGAVVHIGHDAAHVRGADLLVVTSAVPENHVELMAARAQGIPIYRRRDFLATLMQEHIVIAVAGTHGKTTTTAMVVQLLQNGGIDPSYIVGGVMGNTGTNAAVGLSNVFVIEADEYDHMFLGLCPDVAIFTSLEYDHPDFFETEDAMHEAFTEFLRLVHPDGSVIVCADDPAALALARSVTTDRQRLVTYSAGGQHDADLCAVNIHVDASGCTKFDVRVKYGQIESNAATVELPLPGIHNVRNALAALAAADGQGVFIPDGAAALAIFKSTGRRFEVRGVRSGVTVIDDYAHHPTAVQMTLDAARARYPDCTIWAVWQPHMFSRTQRLINAYAAGFDAADHVLVTDVYAAREEPIPGVDAQWAASRINHDDARASGSLDATVSLLRREVEAPAVIVIMSAGDAPRIGQAYLIDDEG